MIHVHLTMVSRPCSRSVLFRREHQVYTYQTDETVINRTSITCDLNSKRNYITLRMGISDMKGLSQLKIGLMWLQEMYIVMVMNNKLIWNVFIQVQCFTDWSNSSLYLPWFICKAFIFMSILGDEISSRQVYFHCFHNVMTSILYNEHTSGSRNSSSSSSSSKATLPPPPPHTHTKCSTLRWPKLQEHVLKVIWIKIINK